MRREKNDLGISTYKFWKLLISCTNLHHLCKDIVSKSFFCVWAEKKIELDTIIIIHNFRLPQRAQQFFISIIVKQFHCVSEINCQIKIFLHLRLGALILSLIYSCLGHPWYLTTRYLCLYFALTNMLTSWTGRT